MRLKLLAIVALAACGALALPGAAGAGAGDLADTKVTIRGESGGFFGYVKSSRPNRCADDRKVVLWEQRHGDETRDDDKKIASDTASPNGDRYQWSTGNAGSDPGKYYARARKIDGCRGDVSETIRG